MTQSTSAAVHIQGSTIRYAEIEREGTALILRRLDQTTAEVDLARAVWGEEETPDALDRAEDLVQEMMGDADVSLMGWVVDPLDVYSFFMPLPEGLGASERERRIAYQAALTTDTRSPEALHTTSHAVRTVEVEGETTEWVHVLAVPQPVADRMASLSVPVPASNRVRMTSPKAAAQAMRRHAGGQEETADADDISYRLAMGQYPSHTEYALTHNGQWHHAHAAEEARAAENRVYYAVGFLNRIEVSPDQVDEVFVYGPDAAPDPEGPIAEVFGMPPVRLDPFVGLRVTDESPAQGPAGGYVPCIGGALAAQPT